MNSINPYSPPQAAVSDTPQAKYALSGASRSVLCALAIVQALLTLRYSNVYWELVKTGATHPLALLIGAPAALCLYCATVLAVLSRAGAKILYLCAAIGLAVAYPLWNWHYSWATPIALGALLAAGGWLAIARAAKALPTSANANG